MLDDYRGCLPRQLLLRLLDRYPLVVETKGGHVTWAPDCIWITSNYDTAHWYKALSYAPIDRRIDVKVNFDEGYSYTAPPACNAGI